MQKKIIYLTKNKGFSLIELVVVISIIGILLPPIMNPMFTIFVKHQRIEELNLAQNLAEGKLEYLYNQNFTDIITETKTYFPAPYNNYSYTINTDYVLGPNQLDTVAGSATDYKKTRISVNTPTNTDYELVTLFTNHGFK